MPTKKNIESPEKLYEYFEQYKTYCKDNPKKEQVIAQKFGEAVNMNREIPYTWQGFEVWLYKNKKLVKLQDYKSDKDERYTEYACILRVIENEIYEDKYSGAAAGVFNNNIIARDLQLTDKKDHRSSDGTMSPKPTIITTDNEAVSETSKLIDELTNTDEKKEDANN